MEKSSIIKSLHVIKPLSCTLSQWAGYLWYSIWYIVLGQCIRIFTIYICMYMYVHMYICIYLCGKDVNIMGSIAILVPM